MHLLRPISRSLVKALFGAAVITTALSSCQKPQPKDDHSDHTMAVPEEGGVKDDPRFPGGAEYAVARLHDSPRHAEYVKIPVSSNKKQSLDAFVVYPERKTGAPVVIVIHEIFGLTSWVKSVADQLAAEGFIAIAPDMLSPNPIKGSPDSTADSEKFREAVSALSPATVRRYLDATVKYGNSLPAASQKVGIVGFCWGGSMSFMYSSSPNLAAAVAYYGSSPSSPKFYDSVTAPVLGIYAGNDARVNTTIPIADSAMKANRKTFEVFTYEGAGHGFLRQQSGADGANLNATKEAWPATIAWFRRYLEE